MPIIKVPNAFAKGFEHETPRKGFQHVIVVLLIQFTGLPPNSLGTLQQPQYQMNKTPQPGMDSVLPPQQPAKIKKGVKRKADTTTPANSFESPYALADPAKSAKIATRRESGRQVMKVGGYLRGAYGFI